MASYDCLADLPSWIGTGSYAVGVYTDWTPIDGRDRLFPESLDREDPWQFSNVLVR